MKTDNDQVIQDVYKCAKKLIYTYGVKGWNIQMLADETGMARGTLYKIIGSKEKVIEDIVLSHIKNNVESIIRFTEKEGDWSNRDAAIKTFYQISQKFISNMESFEPVVMPQVYKEYPAIKLKARALVEKLSEQWHYIFEKCQTAGVIRKDVKPKLYMDIVQSIMLFYIQKGVDRSLFMDQVKEIFGYVMEGIKA